MRRLKAVAIVAVVMFLFVGAILPVYAQLGEKQKEKDEITKELEKRTAEETQIRARISKVEADLARLDNDLRQSQAELKALNTQIAQMETDINRQEDLIEEITQRIQDTEEYLEEQNEYLDHRLRAIYQNGTVTYLEVLFSASSFSDFLSRFNFLRSIIESDVELVNEIKITQLELEADKQQLQDVLTQLVADREQVVVARNQAIQEEKRVKALVTAQRNAKDNLQQDFEVLSNLIGELQQIEDDLTEEIKRLAAQQGYDGNAPTLFLWPTSAGGYITSDYGWRTLQGKLNWHRGIDIGGGLNLTPIVAAATGKVTIARYHNSYGNYVVVDHGGGISTLYAHMAYTPDVKVGDIVIMGQRLGLVGNTGNSFGPHLHFEIRVHGVDTNPIQYEFIK